jgi:diguanylate cyclase (GGDEF)-like protein
VTEQADRRSCGDTAPAPATSELGGKTDAIPALCPLAYAYLGALVLVAVCAASALIAHESTLGLRDAALAPALLVLLAAAYRRPLPFGPHAHLVLDTAVLLGAALLLPAGLAASVALGGPLLANLPRREPWSQAAFNAGQAVLQVVSGTLVLGLLGWARLTPFADARFLVTVPLAGLAMYLVNTAAVAGIVALQDGAAISRIWWRYARLDRTEAAGHGVQWGLALLAAIVADGHPWGLILLAMPGIVVFGALDRHVRLRLRAEEQLVYLAFYDSLTGLPNRARLTEHLDAAVAAGCDDGSLAVLFLDLDGFKLINDSFGHAAGDLLLVEVAARLRTCVRPEDIVARLGGDEFVVVARITGPSQPAQVADRIVAALARRPVVLAGRGVYVGTSVGIAVAGPQHRSGDDLLRDADLALYRAKQAGRGQSVLFDQTMARPTRRRLAEEAELRRAQAASEFGVVYRPEVDPEPMIHRRHPQEASWSRRHSLPSQRRPVWCPRAGGGSSARHAGKPSGGRTHRSNLCWTRSTSRPGSCRTPARSTTRR